MACILSSFLYCILGKANEQSLPLMYNVSLPYSVFGEIPTSSTLDTFEHAADDLKLPLQMKKSARYHTRVMTAPNSLLYRNTSVLKSPSLSIDPIKLESTPSPVAAPKEYDFYNYLNHQQQALPSIDTNNLSFDAPLLNSAVDDLPPLSADTLYTPGTMQATPTEYHSSSMFTPFEKQHHLHILTPDLIPTSSSPTFVYQQAAPSTAAASASAASAPSTTSIYDVFTPEEIQQPLGSCSITPTQEEEEYYTIDSPAQQRDYFGSMDASSDDTSHISLLQQQLQLHNETASNIILNSSSMLLLSPPPQQKTIDVRRRKSKRKVLEQEDEDHQVVTLSDAYQSDSNSEPKKQRCYYTSSSPSPVQ
jgi:hypothetical protein